MTNSFYTYAYLRRDGTPYYIGKGKGNRAWSRRRKGVRPPKDRSRILILKSNLSEQDAFKHEKYMISVYGRKDIGTGILHNRTDGGEGSSGAVRSEEAKKKSAEKMKGKKMPPPLKGVQRQYVSFEERKHKSKRSNSDNRSKTKNIRSEKITYRRS